MLQFSKTGTCILNQNNDLVNVVQFAVYTWPDI